MKTFILFCVALVAVVNASSRLCSNGFTYLGDDETNPSESFSRSYWVEEIDRSPAYSCYKIQKAKDGLNEALDKCGQYKGHLLALDNFDEVKRLTKLFNDVTETKTYLTSGFHFMDVDKWMWLGTNSTVQNQEIGNQSDTNQCLSIKVTRGNNNTPSIGFIASKCLSETEYICEVRAQTVTYRAWFYSNWLTLLLAIMVTILLVSLVASLVKFNRKARVYRGRHNSAGIQRAQNNVNATLFNDAPPSYRDVTGQNKEKTMDRYKNKGKEILSKVYKNSSA